MNLFRTTDSVISAFDTALGALVTPVPGRSEPDYLIYDCEFNLRSRPVVAALVNQHHAVELRQRLLATPVATKEIGVHALELESVAASHLLTDTGYRSEDEYIRQVARGHQETINFFRRIVAGYTVGE